MLMNDSTRVRARSITCSLNWQKFRQPAPPDVDERRLAAAERVAVWLNGGVGVAQVRVLLRAEEHVRVNVDEAGHDVEPGRIGDATSLRRDRCWRRPVRSSPR